jgi:putative transposase
MLVLPSLQTQYFENSIIYNFFLWEPFVIWLQRIIEQLAKPAILSLITLALSDLTHSRGDLVVNNALLRQQLIVLNRQVKRPQLSNWHRFRHALLARSTRFWKQALNIVQPDCLLRWHRELFSSYWQQESKSEQNKS